MKIVTTTIWFLVLAIGISFTQAQDVQALSGSDFEAGYIISDGVFANKGSMSEARIQSWLEQVNSTCLKNYTTAEPLGNNNYGGQVKASRAIWKVSQLFDINPQVILVTLQKEQGLITRSDCPQWRYNTAMGFGCPDGEPCDEQWYGLSRQLYQGARHFRGFYNNASGWWIPFTTGDNFVGYHPNSSCGGSTVNIRNRATVSLYSYTPYQPNKASLDYLEGQPPGNVSGSECASYGNRNFWRDFNNWFGPTTGHVPDIALTGDWNGDGKDTIGLHRGRTFYLDYNGNGRTDKTVQFGRTTDEPVVGDWNGDGKDTIGVKRGRTYYLDYSNNGSTNAEVEFGRTTDIAVIGDWNGDSQDTIGLKRGSDYFLDYTGNGSSNRSFEIGRVTDQAAAADRNGDGQDSLGLMRDGNKYFFDYNHNGSSNESLTYNPVSSVPLFGDWSGDGQDTIGIRSDNIYSLQAREHIPSTETIVEFGRSTDDPLAGDWNGDGNDTIAVRRGRTFYFDYNNDGNSNQVMNFGRSTDEIVAGDRTGLNQDGIGLKRGIQYFFDHERNGSANTSFSYGRSTDIPYLGDWDGNGQDTLGLRRGSRTRLQLEEGQSRLVITIEYGR